MTIAEALTLRAGFANMKRQLAEEGIDVSKVKTVADLPNVLANILPAELLPQLMNSPLVEMDEVWLGGLLSAFGAAASLGALVQDMILGSDEVYEEDLNG